MEQREARDQLVELLERAIAEDDAEALAAAAGIGFEWCGLDGATVNDALVGAMGKRIERANHAFDKALFIDIPGKYGRKLRDPNAQAPATAVDDGGEPLSPAEEAEIIAAIEDYRAVMDRLRAVLALPFVPEERRERLGSQIAAIEKGSQESTAIDLEKFGLPRTAVALRANPLDARP